ncbi:MAG: hypothetical protein AAB562_00725 [Patescibacteria group bacterium]
MTLQLRKKIQFASLLLVGAVFSGVLFVLQHLLIWYRLFREGKPWSFFSFVNPDPLVNLAPMIRDVLDGHWWVSDGRILEHMQLPNLWSFVDPILLSPLIFLTRSVSLTFLIGHFLVAAAVFVVVYYLALRLTRNRAWSYLFSLLFGSAPLLSNYLFPTPLANLKMIARTVFHLGSYPGEVLMSKYVSFSVLPGLVLFALAFLTLLRAIEAPSRRTVIAAGLVQGLLIYVYITDVMYLFTAMGIMALLFLARRRMAEFKALVGIVAIALATSALYWWNFFSIQFLPWANEFYLRIGGELTREFRVSQWKEYLLYAAFALAIWVIGKRMRQETIATYLVGFILSAIVLLNLQVIVGFNPAPTVWAGHQLYFGFFLAWLVLAHWIYQMQRARHPRAALAFAASLVVMVVLVVLRIIVTQAYIASYMYPAHTIPQNVRESLAWLEQNTPRDSVVVSPSLVTNALVPVFTHNAVIMPVAVTSPAPQAEIIDRLYVTYALYGVSPEYLRSALAGSLGKADNFAFGMENALTTFLFESYYVDHSIDGYFLRRTADIPLEVAGGLVEDYENYPRRLGYLLNRYQIDYLYVGPYERRFSYIDFDRQKYLEKVYETDGVAIYRIIKEGIDARRVF